MDLQKNIWTGLGLGAGLMYMLDPTAGRRRRHIARDKAASLVRRSGEAAGRVARDVEHRVQGLAAAATDLFEHELVDDATLAERVRAKLGRVVSHPHAVEVSVQDGRATLSGPILAHEAERLLAKIRRVPGVREVEDGLERHATPDGVPSLQGGVERAEMPELLQENWAPAIRCLAATAGSGLVAWGVRRGDRVGLALGTAGAALLARAGTNRRLTKVLAPPAGPRLADLQEKVSLFEAGRPLDNPVVPGGGVSPGL